MEPKKFKKCAQCGMLKYDGDYKIKYKRKNGDDSRNKYCRQCEIDTSTFLSLIDKTDRTPHEEACFETLSHTFQVLERQGLSTPLSRINSAPKPKIDTITHAEQIAAMYSQEPAENKIAYYKPESNVTPKHIITNDATSEIPAALTKWLTMDFNETYEKSIVPEYLNDVVYPQLKAEFRPEIGWDKGKNVPVYDDTHKATLADISNKFWDYEDWYYTKINEEEPNA